MEIQQAAKAIISYIDQFYNLSYSYWYVGISSNPETRLFTDHKVQENGGLWIIQPTSNNYVARSVEDFIVKNYRTDGGQGGGDNNSTYVYAFLKTSYTQPARY